MNLTYSPPGSVDNRGPAPALPLHTKPVKATALTAPALPLHTKPVKATALTSLSLPGVDPVEVDHDSIQVPDISDDEYWSAEEFADNVISALICRDF